MPSGWIHTLLTAGQRLGLGGSARSRFACTAEIVFDESCPPYEDQFLSIQMSGRITAQQDNTDTDVAVELLDITDGAGRPEKILSISPDWRQADHPVFYFLNHNGLIPYKDAELVHPVVVVRIPLHVLRFVRRGRRRLQATVRILARPTMKTIAAAAGVVDYVCCSEGYLEAQQRR